VERCLAKEPDERPRSVRQLSQLLSQAVAGGPASAPDAARQPRAAPPPQRPATLAKPSPAPAPFQPVPVRPPPRSVARRTGKSPPVAELGAAAQRVAGDEEFA